MFAEIDRADDTFTANVPLKKSINF